MQDIMPPLGAGVPLVQSYGSAGFKIAGVDYTTALLLLPDAIHRLEVPTLDALLPEMLAPVYAANPPIEILLVGTGATHQLLPPTLRNALRERGHNPDAMNTGAACRTFNVLLSEERRVAAVLLLP